MSRSRTEVGKTTLKEMSSRRFENNEDDFKSLYDEIKRTVDDRLSKAFGEERKKLTRELERKLEEAALLVQEMEEDCKQAPSGFRTQMLSRVRGYRHDIDRLQRDLLKSSSTSVRINTVGFGDVGDFEDYESSQRAKLLSGTEALNRTSQSIARSQQVAAETDQIGADIIDELGTQRESLVRTRDRLTETDSNLSRSRKILNTMARRVMTNKLILIVILIIELIILAVVIWWKFFS